MNGTRQVAFVVISIMFVVGGVLLPVRRADAFLGIADFGVFIDPVQEYIDKVLNVAGHVLQRRIIDSLVQSTVTWANSGFEGNPVYVQDPKQFFLNAANQSATAFLQNLDNNKFGFLCSPFKNQIELSIVNYYYQPQNQQFQCTWTGIAGNLQDFLTDFSAGGWSGWFQMTQVPTNNVYGAGIQAQVAVSQQIANALNLKNTDYTKNQGFLDIPGDCTNNNPDEVTLNDCENDNESGGKECYAVTADDPSTWPSKSPSSYIEYDPQKAAGACILHGPSKTPGSIIHDELSTTVAAPLNQLIDAKQWDEVVSAMVNGLLKRVFNSASGLFSSNPTDGLPTGDEQGTLVYSGPDSGNSGNGSNTGGGAPQFFCTENVSTVGISQPVIMTATATGLSPTDTVTYKWSGDGYTSQSKTVSFTAPGTYPQSVDISVDGGAAQTATCTPITVTPHPPLAVSCQAETNATDLNTPVTWTATISGGSGTAPTASFTDTSTGTTAGEAWSDPSVAPLAGGGFIARSTITYTAAGTRTAAVTVGDPNASTTPPTTTDCSGFVQVGSPGPAQ